MSKPIVMPQVGQDLTEGKLVEWRVKVGDTVAKGDIVAVVESEKASFEVEAYEVGTVLDLLYEEGATTEVLAPIMFVGDPAEAKGAAPAPDAGGAPPAAAPAPAAGAPAAPGPQPAAPARPDGAPRSSPLARRLAGTNGIDLSALAGTGPRGAVVKRDVDEALKARPAAAPARAPAPATARAPAVPPRPAGPAPAAPGPAAPGPVRAEAAPAALNRAWLRRGEGAPVVMIHGFGADLNGWRVLAAAAALARPVLALDLPGHGRSAGLDRVSLAGLAEAVAAALAEEGVAEADLVGHSLGAAVAVAVAEAARFTVRSLFLIAPAGLGPDINGAFLDGFARARGEDSLAPWMALLVADPAAMGPAIVRITAQARGNPGVAEAQDRVARALFPDGTQAVSVRHALGRLPGPVRIVVGAEDRIIPARHAAGLPGPVAVHVFPGVGHMPHLEAREPVARLLAQHLRSAG